MSDRAGGYGEYGFTAEFYDHVAPYRERADVAFFFDSRGAQTMSPVQRELWQPILERCDPRHASERRSVW